MSKYITTRISKGAALTWAEEDGNFSALDAAVQALETGQAAGTLGYATVAAMNADLAHPAGTLAIVTNDGTASNNTYWIKLGASGTGSWQKSALGPYSPLAGPGTTQAFTTGILTATSGPGTYTPLVMRRDLSSVSAGVTADFQVRNASNTYYNVSRIMAVTDDITSGAEKGSLHFFTCSGGGLNEKLGIAADGTTKLYGNLITSGAVTAIASGAVLSKTHEFTFVALSDTSIQLQMRGADGVLRTANITLS